jgi:hypothetical protein
MRGSARGVKWLAEPKLAGVSPALLAKAPEVHSVSVWTPSLAIASEGGLPMDVGTRNYHSLFAANAFPEPVFK